MSLSHLQRQPLSSPLHLNYSSKKSNSSYTDQRVEEIKKKYDSNSRQPSASSKRVHKFQLWDKQNAHKVTKTQHDENRSKIGSNYNSCQSSHRLKTMEKPSLALKQHINPHFSAIDPDLSHYRSKDKRSAFNVLNNLPSRHTFKLQKQKQRPIRLQTEYTTSYKPKQHTGKAQKRQFYDSRMENIDRINNKIRQILNCIHTAEQQQPSVSYFDRQALERSRNVRDSYLERSVISTNDPLHNQGQLQQTKIIEKKQIYYPNDRTAHKYNNQSYHHAHGGDSWQMRASRSSNHFYQKRSPNKNQFSENIYEAIPKSAFGKKKDEVRSSSCFSKIKKQVTSKNEFANINQEKISHIDDQINKFHDKIEELEVLKRKMNIDFTPFEFKHSPAKRIMTEYTPQKVKRSRTTFAYGEEQDRKNFFKDIPSRMSIGTVNDNKYDMLNSRKDGSMSNVLQYGLDCFKKSNPHHELEMTGHPIRSIYEEQTIYQSSSKEQTARPYDNEELRNKIAKSIEERKQKLNQLSEKQVTKGPESSKLIKTLCQQASLDEELRNSKNWFAQLHNSSKINLLKQQFSKHGITLTTQQLDSQFTYINDIENDPFFSFRQEKYSIALVIEHYLQANQFWKQQVINQWNLSTLFEKEDFHKKLNHKQNLTIEDFVRLLNFQTGNFYRNRDLYLIFERIKTQLGSHDDFISIDELKKVIGQ